MHSRVPQETEVFLVQMVYPVKRWVNILTKYKWRYYYGHHLHLLLGFEYLMFGQTGSPRRKRAARDDWRERFGWRSWTQWRARFNRSSGKTDTAKHPMLLLCNSDHRVFDKEHTVIVYFKLPLKHERNQTKQTVDSCLLLNYTTVKRTEHVLYKTKTYLINAKKRWIKFIKLFRSDFQ